MEKPKSTTLEQVEWGLSITGVPHSPFSGKDVKIALIDSGYDPTHPDFQKVNWVSKSFLYYEDEWDQYGHGTYNAGLIAGPLNPMKGLRYGIAYKAKLYSAKIISKKGLADEKSLLEAIKWGLDEGCKVFCIPLGMPAFQRNGYSEAFESLAQLALKKNALIIASAGNQSNRKRKIIRPIAHPANCPSVLAVGGIDSQQQLYNQSNSQLPLTSGTIELVGPAVNILSSSKMPKMYGHRNGTSSATAIVAGIATLYLEAFPNLTAPKLKTLLLNKAKKLCLPTKDVGAGLVQAPIH